MPKAKIITLELPFGSHPYAVRMLKEVYEMSVRDYEVLKMCADGPLYPQQCSKSMLASAKNLESCWLTWVSHKQRWEIEGAGHHILASISYLIHDYTPLRKGEAKVLPISNDRAERNRNGRPAS